MESVDMDERQCSQRAVLQARSTQLSRLTSIILAEDVGEERRVSAEVRSVLCVNSGLKLSTVCFSDRAGVTL